MKKIYVSLVVALSTFILQAQQNIGFENLNLPKDTAVNGKNNSDNFVFQDLYNTVTLSNEYNTNWDYWSGGFAISTHSDSITPGVGNMYSTIKGAGDTSSTFAICNNSGTITFNAPVYFESLMITNTAYAYYSMKNGDQFAKKFGSTKNASGNDDGTNGADYFKVWFILKDELGNKLDSIEYYLADYRDADSTKDYIIDEWEKIENPNKFLRVKSIEARLESSDASQWGLNTPAFFAIDNLLIDYLEGVNELLNEQLSIYPNPATNQLTISGLKGVVSLMDVNGNMLYTSEMDGFHQIQLEQIHSGIYFISVQTTEGIATKKVTKL